MEATVTYKCPNCEAGLRFDAAKQTFSCEFCLSDFTEEELRSTASAERAERTAQQNAEFAEQSREYHCPSCGAEVVTDATTVADACYYCHNPIVLSDKVSGTLRPDKIIPFKLDKAQAQQMLRRYVRRRLLVPRDYLAQENLGRIAGVYYPFWVTDADTQADMEGMATRVRSWRQGNFRYTETMRFRVLRGGDIHFEDITTSALSEGDKKMLEGILPYPPDCHQDFAMPYLQGYVAKKRDVERETLSAEVRDRMNGYATTLLRDTVRGYATVHVENTSVQVQRSAWEYTLMPIWILTYKMRNKVYTYAMNGHTGKIYGELPISPYRLAALCGGLLSVLTLLIFLIGYFLIG